METFVIAFALLFILWITFDLGMRDLFPTRYKNMIDSQQRKWQALEFIPFPHVQKFLTVVFRLVVIYALGLFGLFCLNVLGGHPKWLAYAHEYYRYGLILSMFPLSIAKLYVYFKGNAKSMEVIDKDQYWGSLIVYFLVFYWIAK